MPVGSKSVVESWAFNNSISLMPSKYEWVIVRVRVSTCMAHGIWNTVQHVKTIRAASINISADNRHERPLS